MRCCNIAPHSIGRKIEDIPITPRCQNNRVSRMPADFARNHIAHNDPLCVAVYQNDIQATQNVETSLLYLDQSAGSAQE